jgi:hypothetical protein
MCRHRTLLALLLVATASAGDARSEARTPIPTRSTAAPATARPLTPNRPIFMRSSAATVQATPSGNGAATPQTHRRVFSLPTKPPAAVGKDDPRPNLPNYSHLPLHRRPVGW